MTIPPCEYTTHTDDAEDNTSDQDHLEEYHETPLLFHARRSPLLCRHGCVASSQPLASEIGLSILKAGGNAADAALAVAAALCVIEPCSTGLGGDLFCLYYDASTRRISSINGSGASPAALTFDRVQELYGHTSGRNGNGNDNRNELDEMERKFCRSPHSVTVPGAARGWEDLYRRHGSYCTRSQSLNENETCKSGLEWADLLQPAIQLAEDGFPVGPITARMWRDGSRQQIRPYSMKSRATTSPLDIEPRTGDIIRNRDLANVLKALAESGDANVFYQGWIGEAIVEAVQEHGGCLRVEDLHRHASSEFPTPIGVQYRHGKLWQVPPNGQGVAALIALQGLSALEESGTFNLNDPPYFQSSGNSSVTPTPAAKTAYTYHALIEMMRLGFADAHAHVTDPDHMRVSNAWLLDADRIKQRAQALFDREKAVMQGLPADSAKGAGTVSFQVVDAYGNAVSLVQSNYCGFGTGIIPRKCGFSLQNRGYGFHLHDPTHPNCVGPRKRPFHTIIPGMITHADTGELFATLSNMGGHMQPQGHLQLTVALLAGQLDPQAAIDAPRFCITEPATTVTDQQQQQPMEQHKPGNFGGGSVLMEDGVDESVLDLLVNSYQHMITRGSFRHYSRPRGKCRGVVITSHDRFVFGRAQIIVRDRRTGVLWAGSDGRADGCAMGY